jgi:predicted ATPase
VTLTGPGGVGKTRLALQVAVELLAAFAHGVFLVRLEPLSDPELVMASVAQALGLRDADGRAPAEPTCAFLRDRRLLLVLDNFEHVTDAAPQVATLLAASSGLRILVTSRRPLHVRGEQEFPVAPLELPDRAAPESAAAVGDRAAVRLFVERAQAALPAFELTDANAAAVAAVCRELDGLPLAIELAAARVKLLTPEAMLRRLSDRLGLLTHGPRDAPERLRSLRATVDWSYELLTDEEKRLFRQLGVFAGGFTVEVAEAVSGIGGDALEQIDALVDSSLVRRVDAGVEPRLDLLGSVRAYALARLEDAGERAAAAERHMRHYIAMAERAYSAMFGLDQAAWLDQLSREHENLRAAGDRATEVGDADAVRRLAVAPWPFWYVRGHVAEGRRRLAEALALTGAPGP